MGKYYISQASFGSSIDTYAAEVIYWATQVIMWAPQGTAMTVRSLFASEEQKRLGCDVRATAAAHTSICLWVVAEKYVSQCFRSEVNCIQEG